LFILTSLLHSKKNQTQQIKLQDQQLILQKNALFSKNVAMNKSNNEYINHISHEI